MTNEDNKELVNKNINSDDITFPITLNTVIEENLNTVFYLEKYGNFKQDLSTLNKTKFNENGIIILDKNVIRIENAFFVQNIPFNLITTIEANESTDYFWSILLENNEKILLRFTDNSSTIKENFNILQKIFEDYKNEPKELYKLMNTIHQRKSLIKALPAQTTIQNNIDSISGLTINSIGYLALYNDFVIISTNYYQQNFPYHLITDARLNNGVLEIIFNTPGTIYVDYSWHQEEMARNIVNTIYEKKNNLNPTQGVVNSYNINNQGNNLQTTKPQDNQIYQQSLQQNHYAQYNQNNMPINQKSVAVGVILNMLVVGLGFAYVGKWGEGILLFIGYSLLIFLGVLLLILGIGIIFLFLALILWIISLVKTIEMIEKYNKGQLY